MWHHLPTKRLAASQKVLPRKEKAAPYSDRKAARTLDLNMMPLPKAFNTFLVIYIHCNNHYQRPVEPIIAAKSYLSLSSSLIFSGKKLFFSHI